MTVAVVGAGLLLAACARPVDERGSAAGAAPTAGPSSSTAPAPPSTAPPSTSAPPTATPSPTTAGAGAGQVVVRGTVRTGVEHGCLLLDGQDNHVYLLLDAANGQLQTGARVEVVGQPVDQIVSICGEGSPLSVVSVRPLR